MIFLLYLVLLIFFGLCVTVTLNLKINFLERLALSYLLGIGIFTYLVFVTDFVFNLNFSLSNTLTILFVSTVTLLALKFKNIVALFKKFDPRNVTLRPIQIVFWGFILLIFAYTLLVNSFWPISDWDSLALYDFRAKVFLIDANLRHASLSNGYFTHYPLLTSLAHLFAYQTGLNNAKFIYSLFYLSFILVFYSLLRRNVGEKKAILFTFVASLIPEIFEHATVAYTNLPYTVYFCLGIFYLYEWIKSNERIFLFLSAILVGLSAWVRITEPFWIVPLLIVFVIAFKKNNWKDLVLYGVTVPAFYLSWKYYMVYINKLSGASSGTGGINISEMMNKVDLTKIFLVLDYLYRNVFSTWGLPLLLFILVAIRTILGRIKRNDRAFLYITLLFFAFLMAGTFGFSIYYSGWQDIPDSARRMSMYLLPLIFYSIAIYI